MEEEFNKQYLALIVKKNHTVIPTNEKYMEMVEKMQKPSSDEAAKMTMSERNLAKRYVLCIEQGQSVLYHQRLDHSNKQQVVKQEELFELLKKSHEKLGHAGQDNMWKELRGYFGLSKEIMAIFVNLCEQCQLKRGRPKKGLVVKPIMSADRNRRCQVDLIDLQSCPADEFKHILVYQDHLTKYVVLRPLTEKSAREVVAHIAQIFSDFGAPQILQSDNGREFANNLLRLLAIQWSELRLVRGRPRHSQSQGSVERSNLDIQRILCTYLRDNPLENWAKALPKVQVMKNRRHHRGIGRSPYEAMFGGPIRLGNEDGNIPTREERGLAKDESESDDGVEPDWSEEVLAAASSDPNFYPSLDESDSADEVELGLILEERERRIHQQRVGARDSQSRQANKMLEASNKRFGPVAVGDNVRLPVDQVDRPKLGSQHLMGVVLDVNEHKQYKIGTRSGVLEHWYSRNQLEPCDNAVFLGGENVPQNDVSFRAAVGNESATGIQGHKHCYCTSGCKSNKCACRKNGVTCNSRCHHSNSCSNK